jgi:molybdopterin converting factor small subunit
MISVNVEMFGIFRTYTSKQIMKMSVSEGSTIIDLMEDLSNHCQDEFQRDVAQKISTSESLQKLIFINNQNLYYSKALTRPLENGDKIMFLPPMEGG